MRFTQVLKFYTSHIIKQNFKLSNYHNRGKPKRVLRDDGSDYFSERNITMKEQTYRRKLKRLDELESFQLNGGVSNPGDKTKKFRQPK